MHMPTTFCCIMCQTNCILQTMLSTSFSMSLVEADSGRMCESYSPEKMEVTQKTQQQQQI